MPYLNAQITTQAIILNSKKEFLLIKRNKKNGWFTLPGGTIEEKENILDGLKREIFEETGLRIKVGKPVWVWQSDHIGKELVGIVFACYSKSKIGKKIKLSIEHDQYNWVTLKELFSRKDVDPYIKTKELKAWEKNNGII